MKRRNFLTSLAAALGGALALAVAREAQAGPRAVRRHRRRVRRRIRRRVRRRVAVRMWLGRPFWVVPVTAAVGWELAYQDRVVVVQETKYVVKDGHKIEVLVVRDHDGKTEDVEVIREDTAENKAELEGSPLSDSDKTTPGREVEVEAEEEEK